MIFSKIPSPAFLNRWFLVALVSIFPFFGVQSVSHNWSVTGFWFPPHPSYGLYIWYGPPPSIRPSDGALVLSGSVTVNYETCARTEQGRAFGRELDLLKAEYGSIGAALDVLAERLENQLSRARENRSQMTATLSTQGWAPTSVISSNWNVGYNKKSWSPNNAYSSKYLPPYVGYNSWIPNSSYSSRSWSPNAGYGRSRLLNANGYGNTSGTPTAQDYRRGFRSPNTDYTLRFISLKLNNGRRQGSPSETVWSPNIKYEWGDDYSKQARTPHPHKGKPNDDDYSEAAPSLNMKSEWDVDHRKQARAPHRGKPNGDDYSEAAPSLNMKHEWDVDHRKQARAPHRGKPNGDDYSEAAPSLNMKHEWDIDHRKQARAPHPHRGKPNDDDYGDEWVIEHSKEAHAPGPNTGKLNDDDDYSETSRSPNRKPEWGVNYSKRPRMPDPNRSIPDTEDYSGKSRSPNRKPEWGVNYNDRPWMPNPDRYENISKSVTSTAVKTKNVDAFSSGVESQTVGWAKSASWDSLDTSVFDSNVNEIY